MLHSLIVPRLAALALCAALLLGLPAVAADAPTGPPEIDAAIAAVKPALVRIHVVMASCRQGREVKEEGFGSGVIISPDGYVVTNHHVAGDAVYITCTLSTREEVDADLIGTDALTDIAVLKLRPSTPRTFPFARFGDSSTLKVGDRIFAMGSPLALSQSVTMGVVSNTTMVMPDFMEGAITLDGEDVGSVVLWLAHDASIYPGNSGGPLVNASGQVVGINEISLGLSGAIPGNLARQTAEALIAHGSVPRAWLGLAVQPLLREGGRATGALITSVLPGTPADDAGLRPGDLLLRLGDAETTVRFREELPAFNRQVMALPLGQQITATVLRDGKELTLTMTPVARPDLRSRPRELAAWGLCAEPLSAVDERALQHKMRGVRIQSVRPGGPADSAKPALVADDVIVAVQGTPVTGLAELAHLATTLAAGAQEATPMTVTFERDGERMLTVVKVGGREDVGRGGEVKKAWLPIATQVVTADLAKALGAEGLSGARITQVYPGTAADDAGLRVGDIITAVDDQPVEATQPEDVEVLPTMIRQYRIGTRVKLAVRRDGATVPVELVLPATPPLPREMPSYHDRNYDFTGRDIAFLDQVAQGWDTAQTGVVVSNVPEGGWAALARLQEDDLIVGIDGVAIANVTALQARMAALAEARPRTITVQVKRGMQTLLQEWRAVWPAA